MSLTETCFYSRLYGSLVPSSNRRYKVGYKVGNLLFVKMSQYVRIENCPHKQPRKPTCAFKQDALKLATLQYLWLWHFFRVLWNIKIFTIDFCYNQTIGTWHHFFSTLQHAIERLKLFSLFHKTNCFQIFVLYLRFVGTILISFQTKRFKYFIKEWDIHCVTKV